MAAEWYCWDCRRWVNGSRCCAGCLRIDPNSVRWMSRMEIESARRSPR